MDCRRFLWRRLGASWARGIARRLWLGIGKMLRRFKMCCWDKVVAFGGVRAFVSSLGSGRCNLLQVLSLTKQLPESDSKFTDAVLSRSQGELPKRLARHTKKHGNVREAKRAGRRENHDNPKVSPDENLELESCRRLSIQLGTAHASCTCVLITDSLRSECHTCASAGRDDVSRSTVLQHHSTVSRKAV